MKGKVTAVVVLITIVYIIIGAAVFRALEEPNDDNTRYQIRRKLDQFFNSSNCFNMTDLESILPTIQEAFSYNVDVFGNDSDVATTSNWDLYSSIFFSVTIVTTIGYGNYPLKTDYGRSFCTFYALVGVPLCMCTLVLIGEQEKRLIYYITNKLTSCCKEKESRTHLITTLLVSVGGSAVFIYVPAAIFMYLEEWKYTDCTYFCFISLLTIGFGDFVPGWSKAYASKLWYRLLIGVWILFGLSWGSILICSCQDIYMDIAAKIKKVTAAVSEKIEGTEIATRTKMMAAAVSDKIEGTVKATLDTSILHVHENKDDIETKTRPTVEENIEMTPVEN